MTVAKYISPILIGRRYSLVRGKQEERFSFLKRRSRKLWRLELIMQFVSFCYFACFAVMNLKNYLTARAASREYRIVWFAPANRKLMAKSIKLVAIFLTFAARTVIYCHFLLEKQKKFGMLTTQSWNGSSQTRVLNTRERCKSLSVN